MLEVEAMIAAVDMNHKVVWGIGVTRMAALEDARKEADEKPQFKVNIGRLQLIPLSDDADLDEDGEGLFQYLIFETDNKPKQQRLF